MVTPLQHTADYYFSRGAGPFVLRVQHRMVVKLMWLAISQDKIVLLTPIGIHAEYISFKLFDIFGKEHPRDYYSSIAHAIRNEHNNEQP